MLNFLQIRNYAIIDSLEIDFERGFTCISGETGAGKSILVGALGLLCGNRADSSAVRQGSDKAELAAEFEVVDGSPSLAWLQEAELDDGNNCLLRRVVHRNGRSRAWINGTAVTLQQLAELGELLVEIHGQNEHLRLTRGDEPFRLLDESGRHDEACRTLRERFFAWHQLDMEKQALLGQSPLDSGDLDLLRYQAEELERDLLPADEFTALENEHRKLAHGSEIVATLETALARIRSDGTGASGTLHRAARDLGQHASLDAEIAAAADLLNEAAINCDEAATTIQAALSRIDLSPERLADLERRLGLQHDLARKHRVEPEELESVLESLGERIERAGAQEKRLAVIDAEIEAALAAYRDAAQALHALRTDQARKLSTEVSALMQELAMEGGVLEIDVQLEADAKPSLRGDDRIALRVSANRDAEPGPLRKVASGGELSRISLAIKIASRREEGSDTQVFDEVDAGIGGATATTVGSLLKRLAAGGQALCVTHLAQVAVFADCQLQVQKATDDGSTRVAARALAREERVNEVARMLGGQLSDSSRAHAAELLGEAQSVRH